MFKAEHPSTSQKFFESPASFSTLLAVCTLAVFRGTLNRRLVIGLYQISCEPLPSRTNSHPAL
jgi:hypothetical protein